MVSRMNGIIVSEEEALMIQLDRVYIKQENNSSLIEQVQFHCCLLAAAIGLLKKRFNLLRKQAHFFSIYILE